MQQKGIESPKAALRQGRQYSGMKEEQKNKDSQYCRRMEVTKPVGEDGQPSGTQKVSFFKVTIKICGDLFLDLVYNMLFDPKWYGLRERTEHSHSQVPFHFFHFQPFVFERINTETSGDSLHFMLLLVHHADIYMLSDC